MPFPESLPRLKTDRLLLRSISRKDAEHILAIYGDPEVMRYTDEPPFPSIDTVETMLASVHHLFNERRSLEWALSLKDRGMVIGTCGLHSFDEQQHAAEIGCLLRRCEWGHGYMSEAISCLIGYAADALGIRRLHADIHPQNKRSTALFSALAGMLHKPPISPKPTGSLHEFSG